MTITHERMREGFDKYHLNRDGEEPFQSRPVIHVLSAPDVDFHDHPAGFWVLCMRGGYTEEVLDPVTGAVWEETHIEGESWHVSSMLAHRITNIIDGPVETVTLWEPSHRQPRFYRLIDGKVWSRQWDEPDFKPDGNGGLT